MVKVRGGIFSFQEMPKMLYVASEFSPQAERVVVGASAPHEPSCLYFLFVVLDSDTLVVIFNVAEDNGK